MIHKKQLDFSYKKINVFLVFFDSISQMLFFQVFGRIFKKLQVYLIMRNVDKTLPTNIQYLIPNLQKKN